MAVAVANGRVTFKCTVCKVGTVVFSGTLIRNAGELHRCGTCGQGWHVLGEARTPIGRKYPVLRIGR